MGTAHSHPGASASDAEPPASCPMHKGAQIALLGSAAAAAATAASASTNAAASRGSRYTGPVYNVYSQEIDPNNMMPAPNQAPAPGQSVPLPVERVKSTIPKGGVDGNWLYPSPQMFYNSLVRKQKADNVDARDMNIVVSIHNEMNERTWALLREWEALHTSEHTEGQPSLRRFQGNPYKLSPKARLKAWLGYGFPFDRHDWFVDRGAGLVHYIIDYYYNPSGPATAPAAFGDATAPVLTTSIHVDVRPAVENLSSAWDRLRLFPARAAAALRRPRFTAEGLDPALAPPDASDPSTLHAANAADVTPAQLSPPPTPPHPVSAADAQWAEMDARCAPLLTALKTAPAEERPGRAVALNYCMGRVLCPAEATTYMSHLEAAEKAGTAGVAGGGEEAAFNAMTACVLARGQARAPQLK